MPGRVMSAMPERAPAGVRIKEERTRRSRAEVEVLKLETILQIKTRKAKKMRRTRWMMQMNKGKGQLEGSLGKPNVIIRRMLKSTSKSSQFLLNGKSASGKDINAKMAELNVQVGNLWCDTSCISCTCFLFSACSSFLPQDRVSEFAQMTPQQLLRETQRAAGDENLTAWHDTLISAGKELKQLQEVRLLVASTRQCIDYRLLSSWEAS
ncbi:Structural maintenance of chromosomes protein [Salix suchowensis]|nr:Structural maintenance of chromosomes protein [Salix suchowensis]